MDFESYIGRKIKENYEEIAEPILEEGEAEFDTAYGEEIDVLLLRTDFDEGDETFELYCHLHIFMEDGVITEIVLSHDVYGDEALGDVNVEEVCDEEDLQRMERTVKKLLKAIIE